MRKIITKYGLNHRRHRYALIEEPKKHVNRISIEEKIAVKVIMDCRTTSFHKCTTKLAFKQDDAILSNEQSVLRKAIHLKEKI